MLFNTIAIASVTLLGSLVSAAPARLDERQYLDGVVDGQVARAFCTDDRVYNWKVGPIRGAVSTYCQDPNAHNDGGQYRSMDINSGKHFLRIVDSQGGDYDPCSTAFNWIIDNCVTQGKLGVYTTNANEYKVVPA